MHKRILAVDDEPNILNSLGRTLRDWLDAEGIQFLMRSDPSTVLLYLESIDGHIDLLISDLRMPGTKGSELIAQVHGRWPHIPVIVLTGFSETEETIRAVKAGIIGYVTKPWDPEKLVSAVAKAIEAVRLADERQENWRHMTAELEMAGQLQRNLLRVTLPDRVAARYTVTYLPQSGLYCSGDYMDIIPVGAGRELVIVGDVAGHGLTGALITGILKSVIYPEFVRENRGNCAPAALLDWLNRRMKEAFMSQPGLFITMAVILVDGPAKKVTWSSAGHNPPLLCRSGNFIEMGNPGVALCLEGTMAHNEKSLALEDDDSIWIFTDGLIETGGTDVRQGTLRLETAITATQDMPRSERHATILRKVLEEAGAPRFSDDVTLVSLDHC